STATANGTPDCPAGATACGPLSFTTAPAAASSEAVAASEEAAAGAVVNDKGPHAVAPAGQSGVPFAVAVEQDLRVGMVGLEPMAAADELGAELGKIVDLPVEDDGKVAVGGDHRLVASG